MATVAAEARKPRRLSGVELFSETGGVCMHSIFLVLSTFALPTVEWACFEKTDSKIEPLCWFLASKSTGEKKGAVEDSCSWFGELGIAVKSGHPDWVGAVALDEQIY